MGYVHGRDQPIVVGRVARLAANRRRPELATFTAGTAARSDDARGGRQASTQDWPECLRERGRVAQVPHVTPRQLNKIGRQPGREPLR